MSDRKAAGHFGQVPSSQRPRKPGRAGPSSYTHFPKGRGVENAALEDVRQLLGERPRDRDLLIEHLHLIQDAYGHLADRHLAALASEMRLSLTEIYEVATFYAHFDVVKEGETPPPSTTIRVCDGLTCELFGARDLMKTLAAETGRDVRVVSAPCMGLCDRAPAVEVGHHHVMAADAKAVLATIESGQREPVIPSYIDFDAYRAEGGYGVLSDCLSGRRAVDDIIAILEESGLRGMGGAGFPCGLKWKFVRQEPGPRLMTVNGDEGEPGTFKDRLYLETDPHRFLEGTLIAAWAVEATDIYIYMRDEYPGIIKMLKTEITQLNQAGLAGPTLHLRRGAGAYICGEESAMIESLEGKRGLPRHKPPFISKKGLFGRPTLNNNVETLYWVRDIIERGASWYADQGRPGHKGPHSFSVSGRVKNPGVKLAPAGITMQELLDEYCGGMQEGHRFKGYLPGGASGGILPASMADIPLDFGTLEEHGCFIGSAAVIVLSDHDDIKDVCRNLLRFFEDESCGQCTPCRVGTEKAIQLMNKDVWDVDLLKELTAVMTDASICGLGQAAGNPVLCALKYFREDIA